MPPPVGTYTVDTSKGEGTLQAIIDEFKKYNTEIDRVTEAHGTLDATGKVLETTLTAITKTGHSVTATLKDMGKGLEVVTAQAQLAAKALDAVSQAQIAKSQKVRDVASSNVQPRIETAFGPVPGKATASDINTIKNATRELIEQVQKGDIPAKTFFQTLKSVAAGTKQIFTGTAGDVQLLLDRITAAYSRAELRTVQFNAKQKQAKADAKDDTLAQRAAPLVGAAIRKQFDFSTLDTKQLEQVQTKITQVVNAIQKGTISTKEFAQGLNQFKSGDIGTLAGNAEKVRSTLAKIKEIVAGGIAPPTGGGLGGFNLGLQTLEAQILYNSISRLVDIFRQGVEEAAEFQRGIALIQTISDDAGLSFQQWAKGVEAVSNEFGKPIAEVAAANYDLLSNQVGKAADSFDTLRVAASFARITNSSVKDSVDLMSSAINAFKLTQGDAERISKVFFTTIDLGRIKAQELANTFGRTASTAHSLGISLEETAAALTTLTRQGIQANTAQTLLNNVFQKLLNPTEKLQEIYDKLGFGTGDAFVKAMGGGVGALEKLRDITGGSTSKLAELFNELRGFQGANTLIKNLDELKRDLQAISNPGNKIDLAKQVTSGNFGQVFVDELNKVRNYFISGFQTTILEGVLKITQIFGGFSNTVAGAFKVMTDAAVVFIGALAVAPVLRFSASLLTLGFSGAGGAAIAGLKALATAAGSVLAANPYLVIGAGLAFLAKAALDSRLAFNGLRQAARDAADALAGQDRVGLTAQITDKRNEFIKTANEQQKTLLENTSKLRTELNKVGDIQKDIADSVAESVRNSFDVLIGSIRKLVNDIEKESNRAYGSVKSLTQKLSDLQKERSSQIFERKLQTNERNVSDTKSLAEFQGQNPFEAASRVDKTGKIFQERIDQLTSVAKQGLAKYKASVGEDADAAIKQTLEAYDEINKLRDRQGQIETTAKEGGVKNGRFTRFSLTDKTRAFNNEDAITNSYREEVAVVRELRGLEKARGDEAAKIAADKKLDLETFQDLATKISKFDPYDTQGKLKARYKDDPKNALSELKGLQGQAQALAEKFTSPFERLGLGETFRTQLGNLGKDLERQLGSTAAVSRINELKKSADEARDAIIEGNSESVKSFDKLTESIEKANLRLVALKTNATANVLSLAGFQDREVNGQFINALQRFGLTSGTPGENTLAKIGESFKANNFRQALTDLREYEKLLADQPRAGEKTALDQVAVPESETAPAQTAGDLIRQTAIQLEELIKREENQKTQFEQINLIIKDIGNAGPKVKGVADAISSIGKSFDVPVASSKAAKDSIISDLDAILNKTAQAVKDLNVLGNRSNQAIQIATPDKPGPVPEPGKAQQPTAEPLFNMDKYMKSIDDSLNRAATALESAAGQKAPKEEIPGSQMGGSVPYYAAGGPTGRDTRLGYFDPEEFIMDRFNSRKFHSQLVQMNRGQQPTTKTDGQSGGLQIGALNIHESKTPQQTGQEVVQAINRGVRTGTIQLRK